MVDIILLVGRLVLIALLYLFLFAAVRTGIGLVKGRPSSRARALAIAVAKGPPELAGVVVPLDAPVTIGRAPDADVVIADDFISSHHARVAPSGTGAVLEDLGSTNGTVLNNVMVTVPMRLSPGDVIRLGTVELKVVRS